MSQLVCDKVSINFLKVVAQIFLTQQHVYMFAWTCFKLFRIKFGTLTKVSYTYVDLRFICNNAFNSGNCLALSLANLRCA